MTVDAEEVNDAFWENDSGEPGPSKDPNKHSKGAAEAAHGTYHAVAVDGPEADVHKAPDQPESAERVFMYLQVGIRHAAEAQDEIFSLIPQKALHLCRRLCFGDSTRHDVLLMDAC